MTKFYAYAQSGRWKTKRDFIQTARRNGVTNLGGGYSILRSRRPLGTTSETPRRTGCKVYAIVRTVERPLSYRLLSVPRVSLECPLRAIVFASVYSSSFETIKNIRRTYMYVITLTGSIYYLYICTYFFSVQPPQFDT